jgi:NADH:ubiquinone oxidoreductase subunit 3 (subunit A)
MGDIVMLFFIQNILIFSIIFWGLTVLGSFFYKKKNHKTKRNFYECGFKSTSDLNFQINLNFIMICIFLILYDIEFTFLFPILFNLSNISYIQYLLFILFIFLIILSLFYDILMNALNWQY